MKIRNTKYVDRLGVTCVCVCVCVGGGSAAAAGQGDVRLARQLLSLKRRYPSRVTLLIGNRDVNKMRLTSELDEEEMRERPLEHVPCACPPPLHTHARVHTRRRVTDERLLLVLLGRSGPFWLHGDGRSTPLAYLTKLSAATCEPIARLNTAPNRLRWMLSDTMGSPLAFELRRCVLLLREGDS